jgi:hypothetical protein
MSTRRETQCPGSRLCCPNPACGKPIFSLDIREGHGFAMCQHKVTRHGERKNCAQHLFFWCTDRLCTVFAVTREERHAWEEADAPPEEIVAALGAKVAA